MTFLYSDTKAIILAAGRGERFDRIIEEFNLPKPLIPLGSKHSPLERNIRNILRFIPEITVVIGYKAEQADRELRRLQKSIQREGNAILDGWRSKKLARPWEDLGYADAMTGLSLETVVQEGFGKGDYMDEEIKRGTAVPLMLPAVRKRIKKDERLLVIMGDSYYSPRDIKSIIQSNFTNNILGWHTLEPEEYGIIDFDMKNFKFRKVIEKPSYGELRKLRSSRGRYLANTGLYTFSSKIFEMIDSIKPNEERKNEYELTDAVNLLGKNYYIHVLETSFYFPVGTIRQYRETMETLP